MPHRSQNRRSRGSPRLSATSVVIFTKNISRKVWYDNNGVDEQGLRAQFPLDQLLPASSSGYGNDYNRTATITSVRIQIRWASGVDNPPIALQLVWIWPAGGENIVSYNGPRKVLSGETFATLNASAPRPVRNYIINNPSTERGLKLELRFFGIDMKGTDIPSMIYDVRLKQEPITLLAHSGK